MESNSKFEKFNKAIIRTKRFFAETDLGDLSIIYKRVLKRLPDISHLKNIVFFSGIATLLIFILFAQRFSALYEHLPTRPIAGGTFIEGTVGSIKQLNPLFTPTNSAEDSVTTLIFSGLTKNVDNRKVVGNLAESWNISEDKKTYTFKLKNDLFWHDGERLNADDVFFTYQVIQNPDAKSPRLAIWKNVKIETIDEQTISFTLPSPLASFIHLTDVPIIPEHILKNVPVSNLRAAEFSTNPIGSGPFVFKELREIKDVQEVHLVVNEAYHEGRPYIERVVVKSFPNYGMLTHAFNRKDVMSISRLRPFDLEGADHLPNLKVKNLVIPEYDVLFYNMSAEFTKDKALREAISLAIDKNKIVENVYHGEAIVIHSAILPGYLGYNAKLKQNFDLALAKKKLTDSGYVLTNEGKLQKNGKEVSLRIVSTDDELKRKTANLIIEMIEALGISVTLESYPLRTYIEEMVRPRNFDLILATQNLGPDSDIYTFYHTNMATDPGLNLSGIKSRQIDKHLEDARISHDPKLRRDKYNSIVSFINAETVGTYICWPSYLYGVSKEVSGVNSMKIVNPKDRFWNIKDWYILVERDY